MYKSINIIPVLTDQIQDVIQASESSLADDDKKA